MLKLHNLSAGIATTPILHNFTLTIEPGSMHALMGLNGSGKSTLANVLAGHPDYLVTGGTMHWNDEDLTLLTPEERSHKGIFLAFQYPVAIPGVSTAQFLRLALNAHEKFHGKEITKLAPFLKRLKVAMKQLDLPWSFAERSVHEGFSGGEKKRLEMLQILILEPTLIILDEIDSGLDIDAMKIVASTVISLKKALPQASFLIITHYNRLLTQIIPDYVHIVTNGSISMSGGPELALSIEETGYKSSNSL